MKDVAGQQCFLHLSQLQEAFPLLLSQSSLVYRELDIDPFLQAGLVICMHIVSLQSSMTRVGLIDSQV